MSRPLRLDQEEGYYHVMARGLERRSIFLKDGRCENFLERLGEIPIRFAVKVHAYVLMDNHYHLLLQPAGTNLSQAIQWLNVGYSLWFNGKMRRVGPLFQGRFKSVLIGDESQLAEITRYLHLNLVRSRDFDLDKKSRKAAERGVGLVPDQELVRAALQRLKDYRWSSYLSYIGKTSRPEWLNTSLVEKFGKTEYRRYVEEAVRMGAVTDPWEDSVVEGYLGNKANLKELKKKLKGNRGEQKSLRQMETLVAWDEVKDSVEKVGGRSWKDLCHAHGDPWRDLALLVGRKHCGLSLKRLGENAFGVSYPAVSDAIRRMEKRLVEDAAIKRKWDQIIQILNL